MLLGNEYGCSSKKGGLGDPSDMLGLQSEHGSPHAGFYKHSLGDSLAHAFARLCMYVC